MNICFLGNSGTYKSVVSNYLWCGSLWYQPPTLNYHITSYLNHKIYDVSDITCEKLAPPYHLMDLYVIFLDGREHIRGKSYDYWYRFIKHKNNNAKIVVTMAPRCLEECLALAIDIKCVVFNMTYCNNTVLYSE